MLEFLDYLYEKTIDTKVKKNKKIYDVIQSEPTEKTDTAGQESLYRNIKEEILNYVHKQHMYTLKKLMHDYNIPPEVKKQWELLMVPVSQIPEELNQDYAKQISSIYSIFKKYIETKKNISHKIEKTEEQAIPLAQVKIMISQGKTLEEIANKFGIPKTTLAHKLKSLYQTSYSTLKKSMGK